MALLNHYVKMEKIKAEMMNNMIQEQQQQQQQQQHKIIQEQKPKNLKQSGGISSSFNH